MKALCFGRIVMRPALRRHQQHMASEKHLSAAGAIPGPVSTGGVPTSVSDAALVIYVTINYGTLQALCPARLDLAIFHATTLSS